MGIKYDDLIEASCPPGLVAEECDAFWMHQALILADYAESIGEVPVGAVLVKDNQLIAPGFNASIRNSDPSAHAEILALRLAGERLQNYRLPGTTLYVTLEPCAMCATAMVHARVSRLVYGTSDPRTGCAGTVFNLVQQPAFNHQLAVTGGVLQQACAEQLKRFFKARREQKRKTCAC